MTKQPEPLDLEEFDRDAIDFTIDLEPHDFEVPDLKFDTESLDGMLDFNLEGIGAGFDAGVFPAPTRARGGVLGVGPQKCGALTRKGAPCRARALPGKGRCKFHGGASTGPKTPKGRKRIAEAQRQRWAKWRAERDVPRDC